MLFRRDHATLPPLRRDQNVGGCLAVYIVCRTPDLYLNIQLLSTLQVRLMLYLQPRLSLS